LALREGDCEGFVLWELGFGDCSLCVVAASLKTGFLGSIKCFITKFLERERELVSSGLGRVAREEEERQEGRGRNVAVRGVVRISFFLVS
jgi:hypothetical protein